ncbi:MAG: hypothetical protein JNL97_01780, partial [Verrucomicrobiales bacterium]|nr:hypothetical protein [Verrucomicrobiales bacterium]
MPELRPRTQALTRLGIVLLGLALLVASSVHADSPGADLPARFRKQLTVRAVPVPGESGVGLQMQARWSESDSRARFSLLNTT